MDLTTTEINRPVGLKYFKPLQHCLAQLRAHHNHFNRTLFYDDYLLLLLLAYYNPAIESLRGLVRLSDSRLGQRNLGLQHTSLGSLSEASRVFDSTLLRNIFLSLAQQVSPATDAPRRPTGIPEDLRILAADASLWKLLPRMCRELYKPPLTRAPKGHVKGHFVFSVFESVPVKAKFTDGTTDERRVFPSQLEAGALYLLDRGYQSCAMFEKVLQAGCSFVARLRADCSFTVVEPRPVSAEAATSGVLSDCTASVGKNGELNGRTLRVIKARIVSAPPRNLDPKHNRGKYAAYSRDEPLVQDFIFVTDRMDLDAALVVELYRYRWQIEIFFRWFKCVLNCKHLFAESENGMELQFYAALIASLLILVHTGRKPNKMLLLSIQLFLQDWDSWEGVEREIGRANPAK